MIDTRYLESGPSAYGDGGYAYQTTMNGEGGLVNPALEYSLYKTQTDADRAKLFLDRINSINLPQNNQMQGIPSQYTHQQRTPNAGGLNPMQMYQNRSQYQNQLGGSMQPLQMLSQYRQTGMVAEPTNADHTAQTGQLQTALGRLGGVNTSMGGSTPSIGGK